MTEESLAIVHEWVSAAAGSEKVFEAIAQLYAGADLYALSVQPGVPLDLSGRKVLTTWLDHKRFRDRRSLTLPMMPVAWRLLQARSGRSYDTVITSHHAFATQNSIGRTARRHLAYVHSPARYVWSPALDPRGNVWPVKVLRPALKRVDRAAARRLTAVAANSAEVARRIQESWGVDATVIHPPVDTRFLAPGETIRSIFPSATASCLASLGGSNTKDSI
ncbi:glycosyltransferase [Blastococcus sp. PRF04-17]|uniref:glycosyltransferase n=1 Tax=Blastococcus sp. PRF04-17 TaxID=2933797 RepID=UPI00352FF45E